MRFALTGLVAGLLCMPIASQDSIKLSFGTYSFRKATAVWKQFQPATMELSRLLTAELNQPAEITLVVTKTYEECLAALLAGRIDLARLGPASYVVAKQRNPKIQLLASEHEDSRGVGLIVVAADSDIKSLADLAGKRFAFGDQQSTIGRHLSQSELVKAGVFAKDLASFKYLGRHDIVFKAVELGDFDAGALHKATFTELNRSAQKKLRILHSFDNVSKPWVARTGLPKQTLTSVRSSLLSLSAKPALKALKVPGFVAACDKDYDLVRQGMKNAKRFDPKVAQPAPSVPPTPGK